MTKYYARTRQGSKRFSVAMALAGTCLGGTSWAQEAAVKPDPSDVIQEVVVTAQKRAERLQDVPVSVTVVSGETLQAKGLTNLEAVVSTQPAVFVTKGGPADRLSIRGIGSGDNNPAFEQSVATFVDGIYRGRSRSSQSSFLDVERLEVLKGPQSVYFGNNSVAGVFNIKTRDPGEHWEGYARTLYNFDFDNVTAEAAAGGPITDTLSIRVAGLVQRGDGWLLDESLGYRVPRVRNLAGRATLVWKPTDNFTLNLKAQAERGRQKGGIPLELTSCPPPPPFPSTPTGNCAAALAAGDDVKLNRIRKNDPGAGTDLDAQVYVGTMTYEAKPFTVTSVTGYYHHDYEMRLDVDGTSAFLANFTVPEDFSQFSQELRVASNKNDVFEYAFGGYYEKDTLRAQVYAGINQLSPAVVGPFAPLRPYLPFGQADEFRQNTDTFGLFASGTIHPMEKMDITVGGRQSWIDKDFTIDQFFGTAGVPFGRVTRFPSNLAPLGAALGTGLGLGVVGVRTASRSDVHFSPSVTIGYQFAPDIRGYAKYVNGFKAGGYNALEHTGLPNTLSFEPEYVDAYEAGLKTQFLDRRLTVNVSVFRNDFRGLQQSAAAANANNVGVFPVITNAKGARSQGVELETSFQVDRHLSASFSTTLLDSKYTSFTNAGGSPVDIIEGHRIVDLSGTPTRYAPKYSGNFAINYRGDIGETMYYRISPSVFFTDDFNYSNNNDRFQIQKAYAKYAAEIALGDKNAGWELSLIGKNLTNEAIVTYANGSNGSYLVGAEEPRSISAQLRFTF